MTLQSKRTSLDEKREVYQATIARCREWYGDRDRQGGSCRYWSLTLMGPRLLSLWSKGMNLCRIAQR
jgi:hypothetical protein